MKFTRGHSPKCAADRVLRGGSWIFGFRFAVAAWLQAEKLSLLRHAVDVYV